MSYTVKLNNPLVGISAETAESGENTSLIIEQFLTDSDGERFYRALKEIEGLFLQPFLAQGFHVQHIHFCLVIFDNEQATVYVNNLRVYFNTIATKALEIGQEANFSNIIGVSSLFFEGLTIPTDKSIVFYFSHDWKRGLYLNFCPNLPNESTLLINIEQKLGICVERILYSHIYDYIDEVLIHAYNLGWFPFLSLLGNGQAHLLFFLNRIKENKSTENSEQRLIDFFDKPQLEILLERIRNIPALQRHIKFIEIGIEDYLKGGEENYLRAGSALYPRIEGLLRDLYDPKKDPKTKELGTNLKSVVASINAIPGIYFPTHFVQYLDTYYFKSFSRKNNDIPLSRHSHGHGESSADDYDQKSVLLLILMFDQIGRYLMQYQPATETPTA